MGETIGQTNTLIALTTDTRLYYDDLYNNGIDTTFYKRGDIIKMIYLRQIGQKLLGFIAMLYTK